MRTHVQGCVIAECQLYEQHHNTHPHLHPPLHSHVQTLWPHSIHTHSNEEGKSRSNHLQSTLPSLHLTACSLQLLATLFFPVFPPRFSSIIRAALVFSIKVMCYCWKGGGDTLHTFCYMICRTKRYILPLPLPHISSFSPALSFLSVLFSCLILIVGNKR